MSLEVDPSFTAAMYLLEERVRQRRDEGWTPEHDDEHTDGELATAAYCYAVHASFTDVDREVLSGEGFTPPSWPWEPASWKPSDRKRELVKAGALILAEIERLERAELAAGGPVG